MHCYNYNHRLPLALPLPFAVLFLVGEYEADEPEEDGEEGPGATARALLAMGVLRHPTRRSLSSRGKYRRANVGIGSRGVANPCLLMMRPSA